MTFIYILIFLFHCLLLTPHTEVSGYLTASNGLWHPGGINSFSMMGELLLEQIKKVPLISFPWFLFSFFLLFFSIHLIPMWLFLEVFLHYYSGHFFYKIGDGTFCPLFSCC